MAIAHSALHEDGKEIDRTDENDIDGEPPSQPADRRALRRRHGARAAKERESDCEAEQQRYGNENGPNRHVYAEYRAADIFVTRAGEEIQQGLANGDYQQQDRKDEADASAAFRGAGTQLLDEAEAASKHGKPLQQTERTWDFPEDVLHDHRRR